MSIGTILLTTIVLPMTIPNIATKHVGQAKETINLFSMLVSKTYRCHSADFDGVESLNVVYDENCRLYDGFLFQIATKYVISVSKVFAMHQ